jgi:hypothetical protein
MLKCSLSITPFLIIDFLVSCENILPFLLCILARFTDTALEVPEIRGSSFLHALCLALYTMFVRIL